MLLEEWSWRCCGSGGPVARGAEVLLLVEPTGTFSWNRGVVARGVKVLLLDE